MDKQQYFHFTIGPVQGFVSQARRTRDFWAGSFILSWLSAVAIQSVLKQNGEVKFPAPDADYMSWLVGEKTANKPLQGSIPNRFKTLVASIDPKTFEPEQVTEAVQEAWRALADCVWEKDLGDLSPSSETAEIWDRQVADFWDMSWVVSPDEHDSAVLDKRKNWRSYTPPKEPGVKCAMMDGWQELSGEPRPNREKMNKALWAGLRENGGQGMKTDLKVDEALCAMAFIKRRFSRHFHELNHPMQQGWQLKGWKLPSAVPSVSYMALVHWLEKVLKKAGDNELEKFHDEAQKLIGNYGEWDSNIKCLEESWRSRKWRSLDGDVFFDSMLENKNMFEDQAQAKEVQKALAAVRNSCDDLAPATPFYAVLMMDGDSLGKHMSNHGLHYSITTGLAEFTNKVPEIVKNENGFLIYAGGDDVLAILPLEDAISCAVKLRNHYLKCFKDKPATATEKERLYIPTTLSGAIEFAHIKMPLTKVLKDAHQLLDDVAKDGCGRDALAVRVWKPGGLQVEWAQPWKVALDSDADEPKPEDFVLSQLAETFGNNHEEDQQFSSKFFFKIDERFSLLNPAKDKQGNYSAPVLDEAQANALMTMEYLNSWGSTKNKDAKSAESTVEKLLKQCRPMQRVVKDGNETLQPANNTLKADGALLVRFLAHKGVGKND